MRRKTRIRTEPFTDLLFNTLLGFTFLFFITVLFINPISKIGNVNMKAEYIVTVDWKDSLPDDVDIWVQDPNGETVSYLKKDKLDDKAEQHTRNSDAVFKRISEEIESLRKEMNEMIITDQSSISDELSYHTPVKLRQEKFSPEIINKLNYSFIGKNLEEGRVSFFRELSKKLASNDFSRLLK